MDPTNEKNEPSELTYVHSWYNYSLHIPLAINHKNHLTFLLLLQSQLLKWFSEAEYALHIQEVRSDGSKEEVKHHKVVVGSKIKARIEIHWLSNRRDLLLSNVVNM